MNNRLQLNSVPRGTVYFYRIDGDKRADYTLKYKHLQTTEKKNVLKGSLEGHRLKTKFTRFTANARMCKNPC